MKIRTGFVSNSSSSSFVIAFKEGKRCPACSRKDIDIVEAIEQINNYNENKVLITTRNKKEFLDLHEIERKGIKARVEQETDARKVHWLNGDWAELDKLIYKIKDEVPEDWDMAKIEISTHDTILNTILENAKNAGTLKIIEELEG